MKPRLLAPDTISATCRPSGRLGFAFGRRFFFLLFVGLLWPIAAFWERGFVLVMAGWDLFAVIAWALDLVRLPRAGYLTVERSWAGSASLNNPVNILLQIQNQSKVSIECNWILDDVPESLKAVEMLACKVPAQGSDTLTYAVVPRQRGDVRLGEVYFRYHSGGGFAE